MMHSAYSVKLTLFYFANFLPCVAYTVYIVYVAVVAETCCIKH